MLRLLRAFSSMRLAVALMGALALLSAAFATSPSFFRSWPFITLGLCFSISTLACAARRILDQFRKAPRSRDYGSMLLHLGIPILILGAFASASLRYAARQDLAAGEGISLPTGEAAILEYASQGAQGLKVGILLSDRGEARRLELIEGAGSPLQDGYTLGIETYAIGQALVLETEEQDGHGSPEAIRLSVGSIIANDQASIRYLGPSGPGLAAVEIGGASGGELRPIGAGEEVAGLRMAGFAPQAYVRLRVTRDPAYPFVVAGIAMIVLGLGLRALKRDVEDAVP